MLWSYSWSHTNNPISGLQIKNILQPIQQLYNLYSISYFFFLRLDKNSAQTDEEKQRERQRNEREQQKAELEAQHNKVNTQKKVYYYLNIKFIKKK